MLTYIHNLHNHKTCVLDAQTHRYDYPWNLAFKINAINFVLCLEFDNLANFRKFFCS